MKIIPPAKLRAQMLSTDLIISLSLFLAAMLIFLFIWSSISYSYWEQRSELDMQTALISIADAQALSPGIPSDWEVSSQENATSFGLAVSKNVLAGEKVRKMQSLFHSDYSLMKERAGAGRFDVFISISDSSGATLYSFGRLANFTDRQISSASAQRLCLLDGQTVTLKVMLWRTKGGAL
ncbi:MAG: hypothetical protein NT051_06740 [Candidatus Micrarchaeota archaeon]|nr:hypothetical protein [Candidatus Micrarchaeota archaeon]